jgi:hypothetical protein
MRFHDDGRYSVVLRLATYKQQLDCQKLAAEQPLPGQASRFVRAGGYELLLTVVTENYKYPTVT